LLAAEGKTLGQHEWDMPPAEAGAMESYYEHLQQTLVELDFLDRDNPKQTMTRLRRLYNRVRMDQMELNILRGVLTAVQNYIYYNSKVMTKLGLKPGLESMREMVKDDKSAN
jgi:tRNA (cytidine32/uridine32-2'-O)-methyltransferase